jgi:hypothetical protein
MSLEELVYKHHGITIDSIDTAFCLKVNKNFKELLNSVNGGKQLLVRKRPLKRKFDEAEHRQAVVQTLQTNIIVDKVTKPVGQRQREVLHELNLDSYWSKHWQMFASSRINPSASKQK